jgi:large subunit ribosomal protein L13
MATAKDPLVDRRWYVVDAKDMVLGRLAAKVATVLMGKHKPSYTPHLDTGDFVVVINADQVRLTGDKRWTKEYPYFTGWRSGLKAHTFQDLIERDPGRVIRMAVKRMLPKSILGRNMLGKLKAYGGADHPHAAQKPEPLDLTTI